MHWPQPGTDSTPTEPGWYWYRRTDGIGDVGMRDVFVGPDELVVWSGNDYIDVDDIGGEWVRVPLPDEWEPPPAGRDDPPGFSTQPEHP